MGDFGIKYVGKEHVDRIIKVIKKARYGVEVDKMGSLYFRITFY